MSYASLETLSRQLRDAVARASIEVTRPPQWDGRPLQIPAIAAPTATPESKAVAEAAPRISRELAPRYIPTEEEIAAACETLQAGSSDAERSYRYSVARTIDSVEDLDTGGWTPQDWRAVDFCVG